MARARIRFTRTVLLTSLLVGLLGATLAVEPIRALAASATTTSALNLRASASSSGAIRLVMPAGATVEIVRRLSNGYYRVLYQGIGGYAHSDYLSVGGGSGTPSNGGATGSARTTSSLNLRAGPSAADRVLLVMPSGASITVTGESSNGFLGLTYQGTSGWASSTYITTSGASSGDNGSSDPGSGNAGSAATTSSLNLRSGASTSSSVILVMPSGASVTLTGRTSRGFSGVTYQGTTGWASSTYLSTGGGSDGGSDPGSSNAGSATTTSALKLRSGPSTSDSVILVMPSGATVTLTGNTSNGFSGVIYQGTSGWASSTYISTGGTSGGGGGSGSGLIIWPMASGGAWEIIQGYQGGTHNGTDTYSFDLALSSGGTAGQDIYAPVSGTILWNDVSSGGIAIDMGNGYMACMFHVTFSSSLTRGTSVTQGQWLGAISAPGGAGYAVTPHVHFQLWTTSGNRVSTPFTGDFAVNGQSFPDAGGSNQYGGNVIYP